MSAFKFLLTTLILALPAHSLFAQEDLFFSIVGSGFNSQKESISQLIELQIFDDELGLSRRWKSLLDRENANETPESRLEAAIAKNIARGLPQDQARRMAEVRFKHAEQAAAAQNPAFAFMSKINDNLGDRGGSSSSSRGGRRCRFSRGELSMGIQAEEQYLQINLSDQRQDGFDIRVVEDPEDNFFLFRFSSLNEIVSLQRRAGEVKLSYVAGDNANVLKASSFSELWEKHPEPVNTYLIQLWVELGITAPISLSNRDVVTAATTILDSMHGDEMSVHALLNGLGSDSLSERKESAVELQSGFYKWNYWIEKLNGKFEYDKISTEHLNKILKSSPGTRAQDFANSLDLTDPQTLLRLLEHANEVQKSTFEEQLQLVTGEKRKGVTAWKEYLPGGADEK